MRFRSDLSILQSRFAFCILQIKLVALSLALIRLLRIDISHVLIDNDDLSPKYSFTKHSVLEQHIFDFHASRCSFANTMSHNLLNYRWFVHLFVFSEILL